MTRRSQIAAGLLAAVLLLFVYVIYTNRQPVAVAAARGAAQSFVPLPVENPTLRVDLLQKLKTFQYQGPRRNIFSTVALAPPAPVQQLPPTPTVSGPVQLSGPAPLVVSASFFGRIIDRSSGAQRAFFSEGDNVYVVGLGEVLLNRFRLVQIGDSTAELEEIASGRRMTVNMEKPAS